MISEGRQYISTHYWLSTFPGIAILLAIMAFNLIGDALRDLLDPRLRKLL
jgi:peptide/nickel transport system permease protein